MANSVPVAGGQIAAIKGIWVNILGKKRSRCGILPAGVLERPKNNWLSSYEEQLTQALMHYENLKEGEDLLLAFHPCDSPLTSTSTFKNNLFPSGG